MHHPTDSITPVVEHWLETIPMVSTVTWPNRTVPSEKCLLMDWEGGGGVMFDILRKLSKLIKEIIDKFRKTIYTPEN